MLKSLDVTDEHKSKLYRNMGLLYAAKGDYENSLRTLAEDVSLIWKLCCYERMWKGGQEEPPA